MQNPPESQIERRLHRLEAHLEQENPVLLDVVKSFRALDKIARGTGFMHHEESYASYVPWWPIVTILGTYSSGKSTFINDYLGLKLQLTGNQAVDDKFTVISYSAEDTVRILPGLALDADLRFPFYKISREIESVATGEGRRIDSYLQLKTCPSRQVKGMILIDSPGFDADEQRTAVLRITKHIIGLSDLVLVFFDARHPEMGTMQDTLRHLVGEAIHRNDSNKFLYVLNQIDTTAREDNAEDVVASWQRALASKGLTAGRFYRIYSRSTFTPIENPNVRARYEAKRDLDLADIERRIHQVSVERSYRIVGALERSLVEMEDAVIPRLREMIQNWRNLVLTSEAILAGAAFLTILYFGVTITDLQSMWEKIRANTPVFWGTTAFLAISLGWIHFNVRKFAAFLVTTWARRQLHHEERLENYLAAFAKSTGFFRSIFFTEPAGWNAKARHTLYDIMGHAGGYVQRLNDLFTNPSGTNEETEIKPTELDREVE
ncbi:Dynamin family protein [Gammaproteobacteria bacterium]